MRFMKIPAAVLLALAIATPAHATNGMRMIGFGPVQNSMGGVGVGATLDAASVLSNRPACPSWGGAWTSAPPTSCPP